MEVLELDSLTLGYYSLAILGFAIPGVFAIIGFATKVYLFHDTIQNLFFGWLLTSLIYFSLVIIPIGLIARDWVLQQMNTPWNYVLPATWLLFAVVLPFTIARCLAHFRRRSIPAFLDAIGIPCTPKTAWGQTWYDALTAIEGFTGVYVKVHLKDGTEIAGRYATDSFLSAAASSSGDHFTDLYLSTYCEIEDDGNWAQHDFGVWIKPDMISRIDIYKP